MVRRLRIQILDLQVLDFPNPKNVTYRRRKIGAVQSIKVKVVYSGIVQNSAQFCRHNSGDKLASFLALIEP